MNKKTLMIVVLLVAVAALGAVIYQEQQKEAVSISIGDKSLSIETE